MVLDEVKSIVKDFIIIRVLVKRVSLPSEKIITHLMFELIP